MRFAMNHIAAPKVALPDFFALARRLGATEVEIRNDLPDVMAAWKAADVRAAAADAGVAILSINALYPFNVWKGDLPARAARMADYAAEAGARALAAMLRSHGLTGTAALPITYGWMMGFPPGWLTRALRSAVAKGLLLPA